MVAGKIKAGHLQARIQSPDSQPGHPVGRNRGIEKHLFRDLLAQKLAPGNTGVKFSAHAVERLSERNISLSENELVRLNSAVEKVEEKGGRDALLMMGNLAFVVSVPNRTVVTAMEKLPGGDKVFTNIDSALIV